MKRSISYSERNIDPASGWCWIHRPQLSILGMYRPCLGQVPYSLLPAINRGTRVRARAAQLQGYGKINLVFRDLYWLDLGLVTYSLPLAISRGVTCARRAAPGSNSGIDPGNPRTKWLAHPAAAVMAHEDRTTTGSQRPGSRAAGARDRRGHPPRTCRAKQSPAWPRAGAGAAGRGRVRRAGGSRPGAIGRGAAGRGL